MDRLLEHDVRSGLGPTPDCAAETNAAAALREATLPFTHPAIGIAACLTTEFDVLPGTHGRLAQLECRLLGGDEELQHGDLLDLCLAFAPPSRDQSSGDRLLAEFGSLGGVFTASVPALSEILGSDRHKLVLLKTVHATVRRILREPVEERPLIGSWSALIDYLHVTLRHEPTEQMRLIYLDKKNHLIKDELHSRGTIDHVPLYPREVLRRVLAVGACAVIIVHNHPSGDPAPSQADIDMTRQLATALTSIDVALHDHVVIAGSRHTSMRSSHLI
jgi:DNA repair protein RadC